MIPLRGLWFVHKTCYQTERNSDQEPKLLETPNPPPGKGQCSHSWTVIPVLGKCRRDAWKKVRHIERYHHSGWRYE